MAQADEVRQYTIPSGPLSRVLTQFSGEAGLFLVGATDLAQGKASRGLNGQYSVNEALQQLLADTGLQYRFSDEDTVTLVAAQEGDGPMRLSPIDVTARRETGNGPVEGFRARNSVSATNVDAPLIETPATVNVITSDFIEAIGGRRLEDIIQYTPGASAESSNNFGTRFTIRGFSGSAFGAADNADSVVIDGFRPGATRYHFDSALYERIDMLKGPSGLLYGVGAPGGTVRYVTKRPQFQQAHRIEATVGSYDTYRGTIDSTGSLNDDQTVAYRMIVTGLDTNVSNHGRNDDIAFDQRQIINPQLLWRTPGGGELLLSYEFSLHDTVLDTGIKRLEDGRFTFNTAPFLGPDSFAEREHHIGKVTYTQPLNESWAVHIAANVGQTDEDFRLDASFGAPNAANQLGRLTRNAIADSTWRDLRTELRGVFHTGEKVQHDLTFGISYFNDEFVTYLAQVFQPNAIDALNPIFGSAPATAPIAFDSVFELTESAVYLQDFVSIGDHLKVFGGFRYIDAKSENSFGGGVKGAETAMDYTIGTIYNANRWLNPYFSWGTALSPQRGVLVGGEPVPFRDAEQLEIGNKSEWFDGRLATTLSLFQIEQTNISERDLGNPDFVVLAGDQRTRGFEFEAVGNITDQFSLIGGYSYLDAEFIAGANEGTTPHSVPKQKISLFGQYEFAGKLVGWHTGLGAVHVGERFGDNNNTYKLPSYERFDIFVGYGAGHWDASLSITNLMDKNYIEGSSGFGTLGQGARRFLTARVGYEF